VRRHYDQAAPGYDRQMEAAERFLGGDGRAWVGQRARGDVLEIAIGTGRNLPYYPPDVRLRGIDLSPEMLELARQRAASLGRAIDLRIGNAEALPFPGASFDTVVDTLGLCTIPDPRAALVEARRVLRPGGRLLLWEHVRSPVLPVQLVQRLLNPFSKRFQADDLMRQPLNDVIAVGFTVEETGSMKWGIGQLIMARNPA
jgi:ubiquinone/menaquinone biosynthesis C-methylase UbiE